MRFLFIIIVLFCFISSVSFSQKLTGELQDNITFTLNTNDFETIPSKYLEFVEGLDQNTPFEKL